MKKYTLIFFLMSCSLWAKQDLDTMLQQVRNNSYEQQSYELEQELLAKKKEHIQRRDFQNGIVVSGEYQENHKTKATSSYTKKVTAQLGPFSLSGYYENEKKGNYIGIGIEKNVKDLFYSPYDSQLKQIALEERAEKWGYQSSMEQKLISLIQLYQKYQDASSQLEWNREELKKLEKEEKKLALSYKLGKTKKIDWDAVKVSYENLVIEIQSLEEELEAYRVQFQEQFRISIGKEALSEMTIFDVNVQKVLAKYKKGNLEGKKERIAIQKEVVDYLRYENKMPDMKVRYEHLFSNQVRKEEDIVSFIISKKLFSDYYDVRMAEQQLKQLELDLREMEANIAAERKVKQAEYEKYRVKNQVAQNRFQLEQSKYEIKKLEYELGKIDYVTVMEEFDKYLEAKVASIQARNALAAYLYELKVRSY